MLRQIREAMAGAAPVQARLDMVVRIIARSMVAEVCSIYLRAANSDLELLATEGLAADAVHVTRLRPGEGLVGEVMRQGRPVNLSDLVIHLLRACLDVEEPKVGRYQRSGPTRRLPAKMRVRMALSPNSLARRKSRVQIPPPPPHIEHDQRNAGHARLAIRLQLHAGPVSYSSTIQLEVSGAWPRAFQPN